MDKALIKKALLLAAGEVAYIALVAFFMWNGDRYFAGQPNMLNAVAVLLLFVVSAAVSGALVLGTPILLYLESKKREAVQLFGATIGWLAAFLIAFLAILASR